MRGTIARVTDRGFGFITPEQGDKDLFFHARSLNGVAFDDIREGDPVTYDLEDNGPKGPAAVNVTPASAASDDANASDDAADEAEEATPEAA